MEERQGLQNNDESDSRSPIHFFRFSESSLDYEAILVVDSLTAGMSSGGIRIAEVIDEEEIRAMARSMTLKYSILHRQMGGAKCGIRIPRNCSPDQKTCILESFGHQAAKILQNQIYIPYMDMNCTQDDIRTILTAANTPFYKISDSSFFTALSVISSIKAASMYYKRTLEHRSVIIEGFGNVGSHIASALEQYGIRLVGISTEKGAIYHHEGFSISELLEKRATDGDNVVSSFPEYWIEPKEMLLEQSCDVLIPCARYHSIHQDNMESIDAKIISPGANNPYDHGVESYLFEQGVVCLPDFVTNVGGILGTSLYDNGISMEYIHRFFDDEFELFIHQLLRESNRLHIPSGEIARHLAEKNKRTEVAYSPHSNIHPISNLSFLSTMVSYLPSGLQQQYHLLMERQRMKKNLHTLKKMGKNR
jgi:glutamate dehydrogenase (NAD(P)+)